MLFVIFIKIPNFVPMNLYDMSATLIVILISVCAVGLFALGLSLTLIFKGHNIQSEISENENMKRLGIKCAAQQMREEECELRGSKSKHSECAPGGCAACASNTAGK